MKKMVFGGEGLWGLYELRGWLQTLEMISSSGRTLLEKIMVIKVGLVLGMLVGGLSVEEGMAKKIKKKVCLISALKNLIFSETILLRITVVNFEHEL